MIRPLVLCLIFSLLAMLSSVAYSLSFGEAKARSTQGQVLQVRVALNDARGHELFDVEVEQILGAKARELGFSGAALDPAYSIELMSNGHGDLWVDISSDKPFTEPYAQFLLQLDSSDERLLSEYRVSVPSAASQATYLIKPGDSLGRIAQAIRPDEAIQLQAIVRHLHANNLQAFAQGDINRIVVGARLSLPSPSDYSAMPRRDLKPAPTVAVIEKPESVTDSQNDLAVNAEITPYVVEPIAVLDESATERSTEISTESNAESNTENSSERNGSVEAINIDDVAELDWVELGSVGEQDVNIADNTDQQKIESPELDLLKDNAVQGKVLDDKVLGNKASKDSAVIEPAPKLFTPTTSSVDIDLVSTSITRFWWLLIPAVIILLSAIFIARHYWRFSKNTKSVKSTKPCDKTARVLALEKKLARQQAYKKSQSAKQLAARQRVLELEEKLAKIQRKKKASAVKASNNIEQTEVKAANKSKEFNSKLSQVETRADMSVTSAEISTVIEPNTELSQVQTRADLSVTPSANNSTAPTKSPKNNPFFVKAVSANDTAPKSSRTRDADDEKIIEDFFKLLDSD